MNSRKDRINVATPIFRRSNYERFMSQQNQIKLAKKMYLASQLSQTKNTYLHYRLTLPKIMDKWARRFNISDWTPVDKNDEEMLEFINQSFIHDHAPVPTQNVFKGSAVLVQDNIIKKVNYKDLTAEDIKNIDVWGVQETYISSQNQRFNNKIPIWQTCLNVRNYDKDPGGFSTSADRSSLDNPVLGFDMSSIED